MQNGMIEGTLEPLKVFIPPHMVQIPLEEYKKYVESNIKGPTVEIALAEYGYLKEEKDILQRRVYELEYEVKDMQSEINRRADMKIQIEQATQRIITELKVTDSDTRNRAMPIEREVL